ncbi:MAG: putative manganese transporter [Bacteroidales bacterium]
MHGLYEMLVEVIKETALITLFVIVMMMVIEFVNVQSKGKWNRNLESSKWLQIIVAALLGVMPGCLGIFAVVSLYTHRILSFAALVTAMIASSGDEIFIMFAVIPKTAIILMGVITLIAIVFGYLVSVFAPRTFIPSELNHNGDFHSNDPDCFCLDKTKIVNQLKNASFHRALLVFGFLLAIVFVIVGEIGPENWDWERISFLFVLLIGGFIVSTVSDHFLVEHLWHHVIRKHFLKVFLWTFGAMLFLHVLTDYINIDHWIKENKYIILVFAALIGIIPESGPHIIFITLFAGNTIPFSVLLANSIVQDGHGSIPLLAESRKSFVYLKTINVLIALLVGGLMMFFGL